MKNIKKLLFFAGLFLFLTTTSCYKEIEPIILTGKWDLDTSEVIFLPVLKLFDPNTTPEYLTVRNFLEKNNNNIRKELMKPESIVFKLPNIVEFYYKGAPLPIIGTYVQDGAFFTIKNTFFPNGLTGASDNLGLNLFYDREFLFKILYRYITESDGAPEVYNFLIETVHGVGTYKR